MNTGGRTGLADPVSLAVIFVAGLILGSLQVTTRSIPVNVTVKQSDSTNCTNIVSISGQRVEVSGSGGVALSVPVTGGK
jgi:hypothetical protein